MSKWERMSTFERDVEIARFLGEEVKSSSSEDRPTGLRHYTTSWDDMSLVLEYIAKENLIEPFIQELDNFIQYERTEGWEWFRWGILYAGPEKVCHAAYCIGGHS